MRLRRAPVPNRLLSAQSSASSAFAAALLAGVLSTTPLALPQRAVATEPGTTQLLGALFSCTKEDNGKLSCVQFCL